MEQLFREFLAGFGEPFSAHSDHAARDCCAALYDALFLLFDVTPENKALEMLSVTRNFKAHGLAGSAQALREMLWLLDNYYKQRSYCGDTKRHLEEIHREQLPKHDIRRFFSDAEPITEVLGGFTGGRRPARSPPPYLQIDGPFGLLLDLQSPVRDEPTAISVQRQGWESSHAAFGTPHLSAQHIANLRRSPGSKKQT